jgi:hypothetical protein
MCQKYGTLDYTATAPRAESQFNYVDDFGIIASGRDHATAKGKL